MAKGMETRVVERNKDDCAYDRVGGYEKYRKYVGRENIIGVRC